MFAWQDRLKEEKAQKLRMKQEQEKERIFWATKALKDEMESKIVLKYNARKEVFAQREQQALESLDFRRKYTMMM
jgi:hypothetical protein